jgi:hypothetical protein
MITKRKMKKWLEKHKETIGIGTHFGATSGIAGMGVVTGSPQLTVAGLSALGLPYLALAGDIVREKSEKLKREIKREEARKLRKVI